MSEIAIRVENLGKQYHIGALQKAGGRSSYKSLRDSIASAASAPFRMARNLIGRNGSGDNHQDEIFWALKDVSFDVKKGEIVGVIGRNGAGKSTLLKLLSRITEPTTGRVQIHGRVGSLLEVGTGFHPELTGRDNVFLNGAILGMKHAEIAKNFDAIVAFAGVEKFIDTPVKHYSSGMYLRLAFAVAAHLQTEVLIVDEVLAVGDAQFQKKCLGKMQDVSMSGRTVLFVSHNMSAVKQLCDRSILLKDGAIAQQGSTEEAIYSYLQQLDHGMGEYRRPEPQSGKPKIVLARVDQVEAEQDVRLGVSIEVWAKVPATCSIEIIISDQLGNPLGLASTGLLNSGQMVELSAGINRMQCRIDLPNLAQGTYTAFIQIAKPWVEFYDKMDGPISFDVIRTDLGSNQRFFEQRWGYGNLELPLQVIND